MRGATMLAIGLGLLALPTTVSAAPRERNCDLVPCFRLSVPLDRSGAVPGRVPLLVHRRPADRRPRRGVTFVLAGGPGQSAIAAFRGFLVLDEEDVYPEWAALTPHNDIVVFDQRGTGQSGLLRCRDLQAADPVDAGRPAQACATVLARRRAFYRTSDSVADMEAIRQALGTPRVTIVGVSYGTYVAQRYAIAHPDRVERLVLDSVVHPDGLDPLALDSFAAARRVVADLCRAGCRSFTRDAVADTARLVASLSAAPLRGTVVRPSGRRRPASLSRQELFATLGAGDHADFLRLDYPGAVVAALRGDPAPLLRLRRRAASLGSPGSARELSFAVNAATLCEEVRFPWPRGAPFAERRSRAYAAADAAAPRLAPFDVATAAGNELIRLCRRWPNATAEEPAPLGPLPDVPVLMLSGGADMRTPVESARRAAALFPRAHLLTAPSAGHSLLSNSPCAVRAARRFIRGGPVASRCPRETTPRPAPPPPTSLREVRPLPGTTGIAGRALGAFELTVFDAGQEALLEFLATFDEILTDSVGVAFRPIRVPGLRGGNLSYHVFSETIRMRRLEYVPGVRVSGVVREDDEGDAIGRLRLSGPGTPDGVLRVREDRVSGRLGGRRVAGRIGSTLEGDEESAATSEPATRARILRALRARVMPWRLRLPIMDG